MYKAGISRNRREMPQAVRFFRSSTGGSRPVSLYARPKQTKTPESLRSNAIKSRLIENTGELALSANNITE